MNWDKSSASTEESIHTIPWHGIPVNEAYSCFTRTMSKAHSTVPGGVVLCMYLAWMRKPRCYQTSTKIRRSNVAGHHIIEFLDAARRARWDESAAEMNFTHFSVGKAGPSRCCQRPPESSRPPVSANRVVSHLIHVAKAPANKAFECSRWWLASGMS